MEELKKQQCVPCRDDELPLTEDEINDLKSQVPDWIVVDHNGMKHLERHFDFPNFVKALEFTNAVGELAEEEGHHPAILTEWGKVTVEWWTHDIKGLHQNDFIMAAKTDEIFQKISPEH